MCFGCLVRKAAFAASGLDDRPEYLTNYSDSKLGGYLADRSAERPLQLFLEDGVSAADVAAMSLPNAYPGRAALDLCNRAIRELLLLLP